METTHLALNSDLPTWAKGLCAVLLAANVGFLLLELRRRERGATPIVASGLLALLFLVLALGRPVRVAARERVVGPRVVVLADGSRSMALPSDGKDSRQDVQRRALATLRSKAKDVRFRSLVFSTGSPVPWTDDDDKDTALPFRGGSSDLNEALQAVAHSPEERPSALVVVSDGRWDSPGEGLSDESLRQVAKVVGVPIHTVATTRNARPDASIRRVATAGAAVAHVPFPLRIELGCSGDLPCKDVPVTARELREDAPPTLLASGTAHMKDGKGVVDLTISVDRAGSRIIEVAIVPPEGDTIPENDKRFVAFKVSRERIRVLHVAGRPTTDVRSLREWLKSDASVDVIAFFILRTATDRTNTVSQDELALIPFPVDELFSEHLSSFDAVVLQDFDAQPYGLERHLPALTRYVKAGGGLIMVGGPNSFVAGGYGGTPLAEVLPVSLDNSPGATAADPSPFVPQWTDSGMTAPLLGPLRAAVQGELPTMPGANILGEVRRGSVALWTHPTRRTKTGAPMPVLAVGDHGDGRSIALGVDGGWLLQFSSLGSRTSGRGHAAMWDGLLGWLMRDPRYEPAQVELLGGCTAGMASTLRVSFLAEGTSEKGSAAALELYRLDGLNTRVFGAEAQPTAGSRSVELPLPALDPGGYTARIRIANGQTTRLDFACEAGGDEWADPRPDAERMQRLAALSGGTFRYADENLDRIPMPKPTVVSAERRTVPLAPPWVWAMGAILSLGSHWMIRRRSGLS